jgi:hypothetical protein
LPKAFGHRHRVYVRYSRWGKNGTWANLLASVPDIPDLDQLMVDGSIVRVHPHGAAKKQPGTGSDGQVLRRLEHQKGYDSDTFVETLKDSGGAPVIPPRSHRKIPRDCDKDI